MNLIQKLASKLGAYTTRKRGEELLFVCPRIGCHRPKLEINTRKKVFHCLRCGYSGKLQKILDDLMMQVESAAANSITLPFKMDADTVIAGEKFDTVEIPGFTEGIYTPEILLFLQEKNLLISDAHRMYMGVSSDRGLKGRLIIPIVEDGRFVCYVARSVDGREPKELSGPNKSHFLYNLDGVNEGDDILLVEGIFDCEALTRMKFSCVATLGSKVSDVQVGKILAKKPNSVTIIYDGDFAGREGTFKAFDKFNQRNVQQLYIVWLPDERDPDEMEEETLRRMIKESWGMVKRR